jgi:iron(III) transport system substrate-binding protein
MRRVTALVLVIALGWLGACGGGGAAAPSGGASKPAAAPSGASAAGGPGGSAQGGASAASALEAVKAAAVREGVFQFYGPASLGAEDAAKIMAAFNQHYGTNIEHTYTPSGSMTRETARVITEISAGQPPSWDLMVMTDAHYAMLFSNGVLEKTDWAALGIINPRTITFDGTTLQQASTFVAPAYNPNLVRAEDAPKDWSDLTDPKWKGRIGVSTATHFWARLAQTWGDERTTRFMEGLAAQEPMLGRLPELYTRVTLGELPVYAAISNTYWIEAKATGAPFAVVETVKPMVAQQYGVGVLKGVQRPNQAKLMAVYLLTPGAQALWEELQGVSSMYVEGTSAYRYAQGKDMVALDPKFGAEQLDPLTEKYGRMVGYR